VVGGKTLVFLGGGDGICYAFEPFPEGKPGNSPGLLKTVWRYDCNPHHYKFRDGKRIYYYQGDVRVYRTKRKQGQDTNGFNSGDGSFIGPCQVIATPVFYDNRVYVAIGRDPSHGLGRGALHCIDARQLGDITDSGRIWTYERIGRTLSTVSVADSLVYAVDLEGRFHCLDAVTGDLYWIHDTNDETWGAPLVADGKFYLNTKQSFWILAAGKEKQVLFVHPGGSECGPIAANRVVYAFIRGTLYALSADTAQHAE
jgi:outer membrane protein assembly factor BamB